MGESAFSAVSGRLVVVSNRLPFKLERTGAGTRVRPGGGGLVTALDPVLREQRGLWVGWDGGDDPASAAELRDAATDLPYGLVPLSLPGSLVDAYYRGFANETLWPLFHDLLGNAEFDESHWEAYREANRRFAAAILEETGPDDAVWVHDYHLALAAQEVRRQADRRLFWFLHTPFPPLDIYANLPWRRELLQALLEYDLLGFQTRRDLRNFLGCVRSLLPMAAVGGAGGNDVREVVHAGRTTRVGAFPISIDFDQFDQAARGEDAARVASQIHQNLPPGTHVLGVDRLDYTKGIPHRLHAVERFFEKHPEHRGNVTLVQVAVPSRTEVEEYQNLRRDLEREVGRINGRFTEMGWAPILYIRRSLSRPELLGYYRACEVALVTPLKDGMNLVAKEYCASSIDNRGVLILSEFAGAAAQLFGSALLVNPHDTETVAETLHRAVTMEEEERVERMRRLRRQVKRYDISRWVRDFGAAAEGLD